MRRRILSVCLPWMIAEHQLRLDGQVGLAEPFAVVEQASGTLRLSGVNAVAAKRGLHAGLSLTDARAICPAIVTRMAQPERLEGFLRALTRWAERFSPMTGLDRNRALMLDITGCAHLFGGEDAMLAELVAALEHRGLTARGAIADTKGAAWAMAHFTGGGIAPLGKIRAAIADLPVAALRLEAEVVDSLAKIGITTIEPLTRMPRGALARRFGIECMRRLDQAMGAEPETLSPERALPVFAARITLPEPIGLVSDVMAGLERLLERICSQLEQHHMGARSLRLTVRRVDGADSHAEITLAQPGRDPMRLRALFERKVAEIDAGFGIDALRLKAVVVEALKPAQIVQGQRETSEQRLADLVSRLGNRIGFENIVRFVPADSHIPERAFTTSPAAYSSAVSWAGHADGNSQMRPICLMQPRPVHSLPGETAFATTPPERFRVGGVTHTLAEARGAERLAPEWWWDDPDWRSGPRDYWQVTTCEGPKLWLFCTVAAREPGWFLQGVFA